jgi:hypothetical protein
VGKDSFLKLLKDALAADTDKVQDIEALGGTD